MSDQTIHLGYEVGSGEPVEIPLRHMVVTGQSQEAGKTTTLEALIERSGLPAVAFVTKRDEQSFRQARRVAPYFRERADWQFVASILEATMRERLKFERAWIMRASKGARSLADVQRNVRGLMEKARGMSADVYLTLDNYLDIVVPRVASIRFASSLDLQPGVNVIDVSDRAQFPPEIQALVMRSVLEWIYEKCRGTITIIPEAWEFLPQGRGSPVKLSAVELIRKGATLRNYVWIDSQDIGGVEKEVLRSCPVWLLGVQREANEVKRTLSNIPVGNPKPRVADISTLERGQFFACWGKQVVKTYVQPPWMDEESARRVATGEESFLDKWTRVIKRIPNHKEPTVTEKEADDLRQENAKLRQEVAELKAEIHGLQVETRRKGQAAAKEDGGETARLVPQFSNGHADADSIYDMVKSRLLKEPKVLQLLATRQELRVVETVETVECDGRTLRGKLASLIAKGFFNEPVAGNAAFNELKRVGFATAKPNVYRECDKLAELGFLTKESGGYRSVDGMKVNLVKK